MIRFGKLVLIFGLAAGLASPLFPISTLAAETKETKHDIQPQLQVSPVPGVEVYTTDEITDRTSADEGQNPMNSGGGPVFVTASVFSIGGGRGQIGQYDITSTVSQTAVGKGYVGQYEVVHGFWPSSGVLAAPACCGHYTDGRTGNTDCSVDGRRDLVDVARLIDNVYVTRTPLCCGEDGNIDGSVGGTINLADITRLIDYIYISKTETAICQ